MSIRCRRRYRTTGRSRCAEKVRLCDVNRLAERVAVAIDGTGPRARIVLLGGCSRVGKSHLAAELARRLRTRGLDVVTLSVDAWIRGIDQRPPHSTVLDRFDVDGIVAAVRELKAGRMVHPPIYDPSTRRSSPGPGTAVRSPKHVLIVEGVVTLALAGLRALATVAVFVTLDDPLRKVRLWEFWRRDKKLAGPEATALLAAREGEEVPFIKRTARSADIIFDWRQSPWA